MVSVISRCKWIDDGHKIGMMIVLCLLLPFTDVRMFTRLKKQSSFTKTNQVSQQHHVCTWAKSLLKKLDLHADIPSVAASLLGSQRRSRNRVRGRVVVNVKQNTWVIGAVQARARRTTGLGRPSARDDEVDALRVQLCAIRVPAAV